MDFFEGEVQDLNYSVEKSLIQKGKKGFKIKKIVSYTYWEKVSQPLKL